MNMFLDPAKYLQWTLAKVKFWEFLSVSSRQDAKNHSEFLI